MLCIYCISGVTTRLKLEMTSCSDNGSNVTNSSAEFVKASTSKFIPKQAIAEFNKDSENCSRSVSQKVK